ncbi:MAG: DUF2797 domain-containing protein [Flavobacteriales bacterium]
MKVLLHKMGSAFGPTIQYFLNSNTEKIEINQLIGKQIRIEFTGQIFCQECHKKINKTFGEGFCFNCFSTAGAASPCIIRPELCQAHLGLGRDPEFEQRHHNQPHLVYLALTQQVKVGITRKTQMPTRWIDQGANAAIILAETPNRFLAGTIEVALKEHFTDKTNWQQMLRNVEPSILPDLSTEKWELEELLPQDLTQYWTDDDEIWHFNYPVLQYPEKIQAVSLDKTPEVSGVLTGIRGQYLYFDQSNVFNLRKHTGYETLWHI